MPGVKWHLKGLACHTECVAEWHLHCCWHALQCRQTYLGRLQALQARLDAKKLIYDDKSHVLSAAVDASTAAQRQAQLQQAVDEAAQALATVCMPI
jgi:hypothetical protein